MSDGWTRLAAAIAVQAVYDWKEATRLLHRLKRKNILSRSDQLRRSPALLRRKECEKFFKSQWFNMLTDMDGKLVLNMLIEEEVKEYGQHF